MKIHKPWRKNRDVNKKLLDASGLTTATVLNTKTGEVERKIQDLSGLVITTVFNTKIGIVQNKYILLKYKMYLKN